ncbi:MAG: hypothetical protein AAB456_00920 [Patescibacteria group bacterium]
MDDRRVRLLRQIKLEGVPLEGTATGTADESTPEETPEPEDKLTEE